eukprot:503157_1
MFSSRRAISSYWLSGVGRFRARALGLPTTSSLSTSPELLVTVEKKGRAALLTLNRPEALNAINRDMISALCDVAETLDSDVNISAMVMTGSGPKAFAAGADIKEMANLSFSEAYNQDLFGEWSRLNAIRKPIIAAVNGYALGGGCELAMMADIIIAGDKAVFGQPEINLGVIPGWGGTQRLVRAVGKSKAMEMILTGSRLTAEEAERYGLVSKIVPNDKLVDVAMEMANHIGTKSLPSVLMSKECVNTAYELSLSDGLQFERHLFMSLFATSDQKEGMSAFSEKREPEFEHK